jgi:predicted nucleotidyltransferase
MLCSLARDVDPDLDRTLASTMAISAIFLFGSRAREDHERGSDTDLLLVASEDAPRHSTIGNL